ncbi:MAG: MFS transporter, partial [Clostridia bacterium]|nr:MFS transporter [Clostridia bacterium]
RFFGDGGWKYTFFSSALFCLVIFLMWLFGFRKISSEDPAVMSRDSHDKPGEKPKLPAKLLLRSGFILIALGIVMRGMLRDGITDWVPTFIRDTFDIPGKYSILMAVSIPIVGVISLKVIGLINSKFVKDEVRAAGFTFLVAVFCCAFLALFYDKNSFLTLIVSAVTVGAMHAINFFLICVVPARFEKYGMVATMSGLINSLTYVGSAAALYGFGAVSDKWGWNACVTSWVAVAVLGMLFCFFAVRPWKKFRDA